MRDGPFHEKISPWVPRMSQNGFKITKQMFVVWIVQQQGHCFHAQTGESERNWHKLTFLPPTDPGGIRSDCD